MLGITIPFFLVAIGVLFFYFREKCANRGMDENNDRSKNYKEKEMKELKYEATPNLVPVDLNGDGKIDVYAPLPHAKSDIEAS